MDRDELLVHLKTKEYDEKLIEAFSKVNRELFVPEHLKMYAYEDTSLPVQHGLIIPAPSTVAFMLQLLVPLPGQKILEIGSGSGYVLALLATLNASGQLYGLEINPSVAVEAKKRITAPNVHLIAKSGLQGLPEHAPFERIIISASAESEEQLHTFIPQLTERGILVGPVGTTLLQLTRRGNTVERKEFPGFLFPVLLHDE
jgi:protein-L-isoaspartate(D-aspartate) O-methyltransferase